MGSKNRNSFKKTAAIGLSILMTLVLVLGVSSTPVQAARKSKTKAVKKNVVVCIDPGHGGTNQGAFYNNRYEKDLTLQIANAMAQELGKYQGISVVMTRTSDVDVSLTQRAQIAAAAGADFLYSIHLNASTDHNLYGAEVWVSGFGTQYTNGMSFGAIALNELSGDIGVYPKGVKTKLNADGSADHYSVINQARNLGVNAAIIEHCYVDEPHDTAYTATPQALEALGKADATAVAKYYGLKSATLGTDYSKFAKPVFKQSATPHMQDLTPPEVSQITLTGYDAATRTVRLHIKASDSQSRIIFYNYSADNGATWSRLCGFTAGTEGDISFVLPANATGAVCINAWNAYDLATRSNTVSVF